MIWLYIGPYAAGKSTYSNKLKNLGFLPIIMYTTRPRRSNEVDDCDYHFVNKDTFLRLLAASQFMENRVYDVIQDGVKTQWLYGTPVVDPEGDYYAQPDIKAAYKFIDFYGKDKIVINYITADEETRHMRAKFRADLEEAEWQRRTEDDRTVFNAENLQKLANYLGKPITVIDNSSYKPLFSYIYNVE